jgi:hypothetical protein
MNERERNYVVVTLASKTEHITHENNTNNNNNKGETPNMEPNPQHKVTQKDQNLILKTLSLSSKIWTNLLFLSLETHLNLYLYINKREKEGDI